MYDGTIYHRRRGKQIPKFSCRVRRPLTPTISRSRLPDSRELTKHVLCAWLGNSEDVAKKHYLKVTDEDYKHAAPFFCLQTLAYGRMGLVSQ